MKININYVLDDDCEKWVGKINSQISKSAQNEIDFSSGTCRPHITLLMGEIKKSNLIKIKQILQDFDSQCLGRKIEFDRPYVKGEYVFVDVKDHNLFKQDCDNLLSLLNGLIIPHKYLISNGNPPHITLGYVQESEKVEGLINSINNVPCTILRGIKLSETGPHGTVFCEPDLTIEDK